MRRQIMQFNHCTRGLKAIEYLKIKTQILNCKTQQDGDKKSNYQKSNTRNQKLIVKPNM